MILQVSTLLMLSPYYLCCPHFSTNTGVSFPGSLSEFDAILFHIRDLQNGQIPLPNQRKRKPNQFYGMFLMESPQNDGFPYEKFKSFFNWTMTYRRDSNFHHPYGWVAPIDWKWHYPASRDLSLDWSKYPLPKSLANQSIQSEDLRKKKPVAWLVSNCHTNSQRENYVAQLSKYIQVDVYGGCGQNKWPNGIECAKYIQKEYMFYLSFENSICKDYVTEKFWSHLGSDLVPIVLGGADYEKIAPPHSFIDTSMFSDPKQLAKYLNYLMQNQTAYYEYFNWKPYFKVYGGDAHYLARGMCQLCEALNKQPIMNHMINDIGNWWRKEGKCMLEQDIPWSNPMNAISKHFDSWKDFVWKTANQAVNSIRST